MRKINFGKKMVVAALLGAMAYLLMYIAFPIIPVVPYMTLDFSGIPILLAFLIFDQKSGYIALLVKEILHLTLTGLSIVKIIGVTADALALIVLAELFFYVAKDGTEHLVRAIIISTLGMTIIMTLANYFFITPAYMKLLGMKLTIPLAKLMIIGVVPFNIIKGIILGGVTAGVSPRLKKLLIKI